MNTAVSAKQTTMSLCGPNFSDARPERMVAAAPATEKIDSVSELIASGWPITLMTNRGMNDMSPYDRTDLTDNTPIIRQNLPHCSGFSAASPVAFRDVPRALKRPLKESRTIAHAVAGNRNTSVPCMPNAVRNAAHRIGPTKKPMLPPTAKMDMPPALRTPAARLAKRPPSGWNIATPTPHTMAEHTIIQNSVKKPMPHMPTPARNTPRAMNHGRGCLSPIHPNRGWITADAMLAAKMSIVTSK